ncbi:hypothetical protein AC1031_017869 [Aphanomyces cochlioides]|nr:hypothetical protein AC1031_017869 [Aphanomyces cochlioides]
MRVLIPLALAISTVVAFNQPRQDSSFMATHQQVRTDSVIQENRILQQDASFASYYTPKRQLVANGLLSCFGRMCGKSANKPASQPARQPASEDPHRTQVFTLAPGAKERIAKHRQERAQERANRPPEPKKQIEYPKDMRSESDRHADLTRVIPLAPGAKERIAKKRQGASSS